MNYEQDVVIDETVLEVEWLDQPRKMGEYCQIAAEAHRTMDLAKENLDFVRATIERAVRADPTSYGVTPGTRGITESSIDAAIQVHPEYAAASRAHIDAKYENEVAIGAVRAFDQRKAALENLVRLHGQQYFAGPSVPHDISEARANRDRAVQRRVKISSSGVPQVVLGDDGAVGGGGRSRVPLSTASGGGGPGSGLIRVRRK